MPPFLLLASLLVIGPPVLSQWYLNLGNLDMIDAIYAAEPDHRLDRIMASYSRASAFGAAPVTIAEARGRAYFAAGMLAEATAEWLDVPDLAGTLLLRAITLLRSAKAADALAVIEIASALEPASGTTDYLGGLALYRLGRHDEAIRAFQRAVQADTIDGSSGRFPTLADLWWPARPDNLTRPPSRAMAFVQMAAVHYTLYQWQAMRDAALLAIQAEPDNPLGHLQLGEALLRLALAAEPDARADLLRQAEQAFGVLSLNGFSFQYRAAMSLARIYREQGRSHEALALYRSVLQRAQETFIRDEIAHYYLDVGMGREAADLYDQVLQQTPRDPQYSLRYFRASQAHDQIGDRTGACVLYAVAVDICPPDGCDEAITQSPLSTACD